MKIKKHNIIKSSLIKRIYSGIKSIKIYIDFFNDDNLYITRISKLFTWWTFDLYLNDFQIIKDLHLKERPFEIGNNALLYYNAKNHILKIYVPKQKSEDAFFGIIKDDNAQSLIKARSLINNDSKLVSLKDWHIIKYVDNVDINTLKEKKLNSTLNFFIKIQKVETPKKRNKKNYKKNEFSILGIYFLLNNGTNIKKTYINR